MPKHQISSDLNFSLEQAWRLSLYVWHTVWHLTNNTFDILLNETEGMKVQNSHYNQTWTEDRIPITREATFLWSILTILLQNKTNQPKKKKSKQKKPQNIREEFYMWFVPISSGNKSLSTIAALRHAQLSDNHLFIWQCIRWTVTLI